MQLYIDDIVSTVTTYDQVLRGFDRIHLEPGESKTVTFTLDPKQDLWLIDLVRKRVMEPGLFDVKVGASFEDIRLSGQCEIPGVLLVVGDSFWSAFFN